MDHLCSSHYIHEQVTFFPSFVYINLAILFQVRRGNVRFENSSGKSGRQHLGEEVIEDRRCSGV
jgi:hypothetical protein